MEDRLRFTLLALPAFFLSMACTPASLSNGTVSSGSASARLFDARLAAIEKRTNGRLGVAMVTADGRLVLANRASERFAMCSTFKAALAAAVLDRVDRGTVALDERIAFNKSDMVPYAPVTEPALDRGWMTVGDLARAAVQMSDNVAANLLIERLGGLDAFNGFLRRAGDRTSRLDRMEPELNENAVGDLRDTTTPLAMATLLSTLLRSDVLSPASRKRLADLLLGTRTGEARIPAGLPSGWRAGHKTGTCGSAYNDIAVVWPPQGPPYMLTIYLDRPSVDGPEAEAAIAEVARLSVEATGWPTR